MHQDRSLWWDISDTSPSAPPLRGTARTDICIIGGGLTGLSTAYHLRRADSGAQVLLLEANEIGAGASGRNAGQMLVQFGSNWAGNLKRFGGDRMKAALDYVHEGIHIAERLEDEGLSFDFARTGTMKVGLAADGPGMIEAYRAYLDAAGQNAHLTDLSAQQVQDEIASPYLSTAVFDPRGGTCNPLRMLRGLRDQATTAGAVVHEYSPVVGIFTDRSGIRVETGHGTVLCQKLVLATNAYTHLLGDTGDLRLDRRQIPLIVRATATEAMSRAHWDAAGWRRRCGINIVSDLFFSFAPTADGRVVSVSGYHIALPKGGALEPGSDWRLKEAASRQFGQFFPAFGAVPTAQTWAGAISATMDEVPHVGITRDPRVFYAAGCWGAGVPLSLRHGETLADLALDWHTDSTALWFVQRGKKDWPPIVSTLGPQGILMALRRKSKRIAATLSPPLSM